MIYNRALAMQALTGYSDATIPLPEPQAPLKVDAVSLTSIVPANFQLDTDAKGNAKDTVASFLIQGKGIDMLATDPTILLDGKPIANTSFTAYGSSAGLLRVPFHANAASAMFVSFPTEAKGGSPTTAALVGPVQIQQAKKK
jgi:hypothetical protein